MPSFTETFGFVKPFQPERYNVDEFNANADAIDAAIKALAAITRIRGTVDTVADLPDPADHTIGDSWIVEADEDHDGTTTVYVVVDHSGTPAFEYAGAFAPILRST